MSKKRGFPLEIERPEALLFDLGGVLIDIDFRRALQIWQTHSRLSLEEIEKAFTFDEAYEQHERGGITASKYFQHLRDILRLECDHSIVAQGWNSIYVGEIDLTTELIRRVREEIPCYAFTNTNATHMNVWTKMFPNVVASFERIFASHELGLRKPEPDAFLYVANAIGVSPTSIVFFDDLPENVRQATASGLEAILVRSPKDVRDALATIGFAI